MSNQSGAMSRSTAAMPPYPDRFYSAAEYANIPGTVEMDPFAAHAGIFSDLTKLMLYSLYQQAALGPCTTQKPWFVNVVESAKWASWKELGSMAPVEAMRLFVRTLEEEDPSWWLKVQKAPGVEALSSNGTSFDPTKESPLSDWLLCLPEGQWCPAPTIGKRPSPRYQHASLGMGHHMYVVGGNCNGRYLSDVQVLDLHTLTWHKLEVPLTPASLPPTAGCSLIRVDESSFWVIGGLSKEAAEMMTVRTFDVTTCEWKVLRTRGQIPSVRGGCSATRIGSLIWVFGGMDGKRKLLNDVYTLDLHSMVWEEVGTSGHPPAPRSDHAATVHGGRFLTVFGGGSHSLCFSDLHVLDVESCVWSQPVAGGAVPGGRSGHGAASVGSAWYVVGGGDNRAGNPETVSLDFDSFTWSVVASAPLRTSMASEGLSVISKGDRSESVLVAFGGYNGKFSNEVYGFRSISSSGTPHPPPLTLAPHPIPAPQPVPAPPPPPPCP